MSTKKETDKALWAILVVAFLLRFLFLALKPPHFDEGINGWFVDQMIANGYYKYDPTNYHGPLHFYLLLFFKSFLGRNLWALRLSACLFGLGSVYLLSRFEPYIGRMTAYGAALLVAVSPGMTFYSRYAIHESGLLFFSLLAIIGFLRFMTVRDRSSLWSMGLGIAGIINTKETFIVHLGCMTVAFGALKVLEKFSPSLAEPLPIESTAPQKNLNSRATARDVAIVTGASVLFVVIFYSGFFQHAQGVVDIFKSFDAWFKTGQKGNGHEKPFMYWFNLLMRYEVVAFAGLWLTFKLCLPSRRWVRLLGIYGFGIFLAYSLIHYKTPWCIMQLIWPLIIVAASIVADFAKHGRRATQISMGLLIGFACLGATQSILLNFFHYDDDREPYVYVQTFRPILGINEKIQDVAKKNPALYHMPIQVLLESNWPIPWLLGDFTGVSYAGPVFTGNVDGGVVFIDKKNQAKFEALAQKSYFFQNFRLRSSQDESVVYFDTVIFKDYFDAAVPVFHPLNATLVPPASAVQKQADPGSEIRFQKPFHTSKVKLEKVKNGAGLVASFYDNPAWGGEPTFKTLVKSPDSLDENVNNSDSPLSIKLRGEILIHQTGVSNFFLKSQGGTSLFIDGHLAVANENANFNQIARGSSHLKKGWHLVELRYRSSGGAVRLHFGRKGSHGEDQKVPPEDFRSINEGS